MRKSFVFFGLTTCLDCPPDTNSVNKIPGQKLNDPYYSGYEKCIYIVDGTKDKDLSWTQDLIDYVIFYGTSCYRLF